MTQDKSAKKDDFDLQEFLPYLLNRAAEESSLEFQQVYKDRYGMLRTEWRVLFHLGNYGEMTAKEIGERAKIHKTKVSRAVSKLEQRRYLARNRDTSDRRVEQLTLTSAGQTVYRDLRLVAEAYDSKLAGLFSRDEAKLLRKMLRRLAHMD
ncbi:MarR family winged helix-turn-helix transcriptional regulator [Ruegeria atlantica]|uniref:MarR family winged helix-turn-helix transcriptional regulator n=1 Tax=Ruegeria atlantica TaxID=81569 RepID=UPI0024948DD1|nr:MarR family winged helix-turn-helix transcriptional regulator [Ruegeria atlantica]